MTTKLFLITSGSANLFKGGNLVRKLAKNSFFGVQALFFEERSEDTVQVATSDIEIWSIEKSELMGVLGNGRLLPWLSARMHLQDGEIVLKDLKHVKLIGQGSAGSVRLVEHKKTKTRYALKRIVKRHPGKNNVPEELKRECNLLRQNNHPFVIRLVKDFETEKSFYMLTELVTGGELHAAIRSIPNSLNRSQTQFYAGTLVLVLEELLERNILYRDLKPENVMLDHQGYLKLIDFGISKKLPEGQTKTFTLIGTPHYMAPEITHGKGYGSEVDIWSLGIVVYELSCGFMPFADEADDPLLVCAAVCEETLIFPLEHKDDHAQELMKGLLVKDPKKRLGAGLQGFEDIKNISFFKVNHSDSCLFSKIKNRELDPPILPKGEVYIPVEELASVTLSDAEELG